MMGLGDYSEMADMFAEQSQIRLAKGIKEGRRQVIREIRACGRFHYSTADEEDIGVLILHEKWQQLLKEVNDG